MVKELNAYDAFYLLRPMGMQNYEKRKYAQ